MRTAIAVQQAELRQVRRSCPSCVQRPQSQSRPDPALSSQYKSDREPELPEPESSGQLKSAHNSRSPADRRSARRGRTDRLHRVYRRTDFRGVVPSYNVGKYGAVALSEGLHGVLAPPAIGVSVLCPGVVRTQITNSVRNAPKESASTLGPLPTEGPIAEIIKEFQERVSKGGRCAVAPLPKRLLALSRHRWKAT